MIDCTPSSIIEASKCYCGLTSREDFSVSIYLLCQWANSNPTPPPSVPLVVWNPPDSLMNYQDGSGAHASIDYPTFLAAVDYSTLVSVSMFDTDNWRITDFLANNVPSLQTVLINGNVNTLTSVDVTGCTGLLTLDCSGSNTLNSLVGLGTCVSLTTLDCDSNSLVTLDLTGLSALTAVDCSIGASITTLTLTGCAALVTLDCSMSASLTSVVGLTSCTSLVTAGLNDCNLSSVDVHGLASLDALDIGNNVNLNALNVTGCTAMTSCMAGGCSILSSITGLGTLSSLSSINLNFDNFAAIDFTGMASLATVLMNSNLGLTSVTVTGLSLLTNVDFGVCALVQASVDALLTRLDNSGLANGGCDVSGGTSSPPTSTAPGSPYDNLVNLKGWTVNVNP